jgi:hypothetical protein
MGLRISVFANAQLQGYEGMLRDIRDFKGQ